MTCCRREATLNGGDAKGFPATQMDSPEGAQKNRLKTSHCSRPRVSEFRSVSLPPFAFTPGYLKCTHAVRKTLFPPSCAVRTCISVLRPHPINRSGAGHPCDRTPRVYSALFTSLFLKSFPAHAQFALHTYVQTFFVSTLYALLKLKKKNKEREERKSRPPDIISRPSSCHGAPSGGLNHRTASEACALTWLLNLQPLTHKPHTKSAPPSRGTCCFLFLDCSL